MAKKAEEAKEAKVKIKQKEEEAKKEEAPEKPKEEVKAGAKPSEKPKEEKKPAKIEKPKEVKKPVIKEERILMIPLRDAWDSPRHKRARRAVVVLKAQLKKHLKTEVKIDESLNSVLWKRGSRKPPRRIKVKVQITDQGAKAYPA